jgi:hypothetical protein
MSLNTLIKNAEAEISLLWHKMPETVKTYEAEALHVCNAVKAALGTREAAAIEAILGQLIPGGWEAKVVIVINSALNVAIPLITNATANSNSSVLAWAESLVLYLQNLSPKMQHSGLLKLLSGIFQALDPALTEVESDTAAQVVYAKSTLAA